MYLTGLLAVASIIALALPGGALAQQKTLKQCNQEYAANKAEIRASGKKKADFVAECRAGQSTAPPSQAMAPTVPPEPATPAAPPSTTKHPPAASSSPVTGLSVGEFPTESQASAHCPGDTVVWANLSSHVYHFKNNRNYGNTKRGAYMCERDTGSAGIRAAKNETHP